MANLQLGIQAIDAQHQELVALVEDLVARVREPGPGARLAAQMAALGEKVRAHFATEVELMRKHRYPALDTHHAAHEAFLDTFSKVAGQLQRAARSAPLADEIAPLVGGWLELHIDGFDKALARFLREAGER